MKSKSIILVVLMTFSATNFASATEYSSTHEQTPLIHNPAMPFIDGNPDLLTFDGKSWATCVTRAGLGAHAGAAFCAYGGFLTDIFG